VPSSPRPSELPGSNERIVSLIFFDACYPQRAEYGDTDDTKSPARDILTIPKLVSVATAHRISGEQNSLSSGEFKCR